MVYRAVIGLPTNMFGQSPELSTNSSTFSHSTNQGGRSGNHGQRPRCNYCQWCGHWGKLAYKGKITLGPSDEVTITMSIFSTRQTCNIHNSSSTLLSLVIL